jgi:hypothetical protein
MYLCTVPMYLNNFVCKQQNIKKSIFIYVACVFGKLCRYRPTFTHLSFSAQKKNNASMLAVIFNVGAFSRKIESTNMYVSDNIQQMPWRRVVVSACRDWSSPMGREITSGHGSRVARFFFGTIYQNGGKMYQTTTKLLGKWSWNIPTSMPFKVYTN